MLSHPRSFEKKYTSVEIKCMANEATIDEEQLLASIEG